MKASIKALPFLAAVLTSIPPVWAQEDLPPPHYPVLPATTSSLADLTPPGWRVERQASGDIDGDAVADIVAVLKGTDPTFVSKRFASSNESLDANPRLLVVLLRERNGSYRLAVADRSVVPRHDSATVEDPFGEDGDLEVAKGAFSVLLHRFTTAGGTDMGNTALTFRMIGGRCVLIGFDRMRVERFSGETRWVVIDYLTGDMRIETGTISDDVGQVTSKHLDQPPPAIAEVGDGLDFDPIPL